jgi:RNA polymerase sigma-70 factor
MADGGAAVRKEPGSGPAAPVLRFPVAPAVAEALRRGYDEGRRHHGDLALTRAAFDAAVLRLVSARVRGAGLDDARLADALAASRLDDLFLAIACDSQLPAAWERFTRSHRSRLVGLAVSFGAARETAEELIDLVIGDLCVAPADGGARTRIGTFDGSGSLFGWLTVIVKRRVIDQRRQRRHASLDDEGEGAAARDAAASTGDAATSLLARELAARMARAVEDATARLTVREALALRLKFREDLPQRSIAGLMGVGEARVSRLVSAGIEKLRAAVRESAPEAFAGALATDEAWAGVRRALEGGVESFGAGRDLPGGTP